MVDALREQSKNLTMSLPIPSKRAWLPEAPHIVKNVVNIIVIKLRNITIILTRFNFVLKTSVNTIHHRASKQFTNKCKHR